MRARELFLLMLDHAEGRISGKTLVQKRAYFLNLLLDLGLSYSPHYYGPYSAELDAAIGQCKALGFVDEHVTSYGYVSNGFEIKRYDYVLTQDGQIVVDAIKRREPTLCKRIRSCLDEIGQAGQLDYVKLSVAAKTVHILLTNRGTLSKHQIAEQAKEFGWDISERDVEEVMGFLKKLNVVAAVPA